VVIKAGGSIAMNILQEYINTQQKMTDLRIDYFFQEVLFSFQWWFLIAMTIVSWVTWWKLVDRERLKTILLCGLLIMVLTIVFDDIGLTMSLWTYPYQVILFMSRMNAVDMAILPVAYMLIFQFYPRWKSYTIAIFLFALFAAFIAEPLFAALGMYIKLKWQYAYSVPIYVAMGVFVKWLINKVDSMTTK
jgi:hypothetical protein